MSCNLGHRICFVFVLIACRACRASAVTSSHQPPGTLISQPAGSSVDIDFRTRSQWQDLEQICANRTSYTSCYGLDRSSWTDASSSLFSPLEFKGLGAWSTFTLTTYNYTGGRRRRGGDSWYIVLRDRRQRLKVPTRVFDEGDGSYTVAAFLFKPGNYSVAAWLWYSDCHGLQQPTDRMEVYEETLKKRDHCYVGGRFTAHGAIHVDADSAAPPACMLPRCAVRRARPSVKGSNALVYRMETYYYRQNDSYHSPPCCKPAFPRPPRPTNRFLFYGDSTVRNSWMQLMHMARQPCRATWRPRWLDEALFPEYCPAVQGVGQVDPEFDRVLKRCTGGAEWTTVPVGTNTIQVSKYFPQSMLFDMKNFTYNATFAQHPVPRQFSFIYVDGWGCRGFEAIEEDLFGVRQGDVVVINIGAHWSRSQTFSAWQAFMDKVAGLLNRIKADTGAVLVWRTSFMMKEHVFRSYNQYGGYFPQGHFNTDHRRLLFDSYAEHVLVPVGVHLWDVYGMSAMGEYKPHDMVHTDAATCWAMNKDMMGVFGCHKF